ncbi:hypothetical protein F1D05_09750 [Kribbella qitaiheensis]|uniref:Uncharacterized protein n=1 Tax=Kribbella qitaiheensis TaxID=1544730 RepID=A0A7G6WVV5_9ACTN|nr:hypothetical protein [Kribbella qitaiheensis]QNE18120.1 hypothetical protein F1D05_09750 [Kribbella qitaiheensis]
MTVDQVVAESPHNHPSRCCCELAARELTSCPACGWPSLYRQTCSNCGWRAYADPIRCPICPEHAATAPSSEGPDCIGRSGIEYSTLNSERLWAELKARPDCEHGYRATDSCPGCDAEEDARRFVEEALHAATAGSAGSWQTVAGILADEVLRLRAVGP